MYYCVMERYIVQSGTQECVTSILRTELDGGSNLHL